VGRTGRAAGAGKTDAAPGGPSPLPLAPDLRPALRAVIFDVGGVLIAHAADRAPQRTWEARLGLPEGSLAREVFSSPAALRATLGLATDADVWTELACLFRLHADEARDLARDFFAGEAADTELVAFLRGLRPRYKTALLSNAWPGARAAWTARFGLGDIVDLMIVSAEEGLRKPDTRIYALAAERLGVAPAECLFVDDGPDNVAGARDSGMRALQFVQREQAIADVLTLLGRPGPGSQEPSAG
jgi:epoxide hydrolase-like predicted phosphatase